MNPLTISIPAEGSSRARILRRDRNEDVFPPQPVPVGGRLKFLGVPLYLDVGRAVFQGSKAQKIVAHAYNLPVRSVISLMCSSSWKHSSRAQTSPTRLSVPETITTFPGGYYGSQLSGTWFPWTASSTLLPVMVTSDKTAVVSYINKHSLVCLLVDLFLWLQSQGIVLRARHFLGCLNVIADRLFRPD